MSGQLHWLGASPDAPFPHPSAALVEPDGLLAAGGDLSSTRLLAAYRVGIFPWFSEGQPPLWWSPDPRAVFMTRELRPSRRFARSLRSCRWTVRADTAFTEVMATCAHIPRAGQGGTWITAGMLDSYAALHAAGHAHSVEVFDGEALVGGVYGVATGRMFFGESMFSRRSGASKVALLGLAATLRSWGWPLIDAQVSNPHLLSLGAELWPRERFLAAVEALVAEPGVPGSWTGPAGEFAASTLATRD
jgi:leucyl/phenylalanyl-tRNA--protein transferase